MKSSSAPALVFFGVIITMLFSSVAYGMYNSFGPGSKALTDLIDEHSRMHELGIAYTHRPLSNVLLKKIIYKANL